LGGSGCAHHKESTHLKIALKNKSSANLRAEFSDRQHVASPRRRRDAQQSQHDVSAVVVQKHFEAKKSCVWNFLMAARRSPLNLIFTTLTLSSFRHGGARSAV
jgi:hypothetical protein